MSHFLNVNLRTIPVQCIYVHFMILTISSDYFSNSISRMVLMTEMDGVLCEVNLEFFCYLHELRLSD